jgi:hypothetical protein
MQEGCGLKQLIKITLGSNTRDRHQLWSPGKKAEKIQVMRLVPTLVAVTCVLKEKKALGAQAKCHWNQMDIIFPQSESWGRRARVSSLISMQVSVYPSSLDVKNWITMNYPDCWYWGWSQRLCETCGQRESLWAEINVKWSFIFKPDMFLLKYEIILCLWHIEFNIENENEQVIKPLLNSQVRHYCFCVYFALLS